MILLTPLPCHPYFGWRRGQDCGLDEGCDVRVERWIDGCAQGSRDLLWSYGQGKMRKPDEGFKVSGCGFNLMGVYPGRRIHAGSHKDSNPYGNLDSYSSCLFLIVSVVLYLEWK